MATNWKSLPYQRDRQWADRYMEQVTDILRKNAMHIIKIELADDDSDMHQATDLFVKVSGGSVAVRVRRSKFNNQERDWTIRSSRPNGYKTELQKLREGHGDWYLYCWTNEHGTIDTYWLIDLGRVREKGLLDRQRYEFNNKDGTKFVAVRAGELAAIGAFAAVKYPTQDSPASAG